MSTSPDRLRVLVNTALITAGMMILISPFDRVAGNAVPISEAAGKAVAESIRKVMLPHELAWTASGASMAKPETR